MVGIALQERPVTHTAGHIARAARKNIHGLDLACGANESHAAATLADLKPSLGGFVHRLDAALPFRAHDKAQWEACHAQVDSPGCEQIRVVKLPWIGDLREVLLAG